MMWSLSILTRTKVVAADAGGTIQIWERPPNDLHFKKVQTLEVGEEITCMTTSDDFDIFLTGSRDAMIRIFVYGTRYYQAEVLSGHRGSMRDIYLSHDKKTLVSASDNFDLRIWDLATNSCVQQVPIGAVSVERLVLTEDASHLVVSCSDYKIRVLRRNQKDLTYSMSESETITAHSTWICGLCVSKSGNMIISGSEAPESKIIVWRYDKKSKSYQAVKTMSEHKTSIKAIVMARNRPNLFASCSSDKTIKVWSINAGRSLHTMRGHECIVSAVSLSPCGGFLVSGGW
eukprot:CAMPEP_0115014744 /NCGR_PEP_ID=MMETSP0216-20121206/26287_1 /TAXON_ID=223996 /ORGANISM="Protocruzia adherens, Strain Boccale" /LENGTH=287 /DNA_ID=CAMNT_0002384595 /DNA_START=146 /DNA_END=1006 /DNA_ORIENTATION=+